MITNFTRTGSHILHNKPTTHNRTREDARNCALSFCAYIRKGKRNNNPQRERGQDQDQKPSSQEDKPRKAGKEIKAGAKRTKRKANTRAKGQERGQNRGQNRGQERGQKRTK